MLSKIFVMVDLIAFYKNSFRQVQYQVLTSFIVNIIGFTHGCALGWVSPALTVLQSDNTPLSTGAVTIYEASWIGSISHFGAVIGNIFFAVLANYAGKKISVAFIAVPIICFWFLVIFGQDVEYLYIGRLLCGVSGGGVLNTIPLYISDISDNKICGTLASSVSLSINFGILTAFVCGSYMSYESLPYLMITFPIMFFISFLFLPETTQCLLQKGKQKKAELSFQFFKNCYSNQDAERFKTEFQKLKYYELQKKESYTKLDIKDFCTTEALRGLSFGIFLILMIVFNGSMVFLTYAANIFRDSGSDIDPNKSSIIIMAIQFIGICCATIAVDILGRRLLTIISTIGAATGLFIVGLYSYLITIGINATSFNWIPVTSLSVVVFFNSIGLNAVGYIMLLEIWPSKVRSIGCTICLCLYSLCVFGMLKLFPIASYFLEMYVSMWILAAVCFGGIAFSIFVIKETKGNSLNT